jgi:hypothetical protein
VRCIFKGNWQKILHFKVSCFFFFQFFYSTLLGGYSTALTLLSLKFHFGLLGTLYEKD